MILENKIYNFQLYTILLSYYYRLITKEDLRVQLKIFVSSVKRSENNLTDTIYIRVKDVNNQYISLVNDKIKDLDYDKKSGIPLYLLHTHTEMNLKILIQRFCLRQGSNLYELELILKDDLPF